MDKNSSEETVNGGGDVTGTEQVSMDTKPETGESEEASKIIIVQAMEDVDRFFETLSRTTDKSNPPEIPSSIESLLSVLESDMPHFESKQETEVLFWQCLTRISKLINQFNDFSPNPATSNYLNRASTDLHVVMSLLDNEFRAALESCNRTDNATPAAAESKNTPKASKQPSFGSQNHQESESERELSPEEEEYPGYNKKEIIKLTKIASSMITLGYEAECCMAYNMVRRNAFNRELDRLGFNNISIEDVQKMQWENLEGEINSWIDVLKHCSSVLFPIEKKLSDTVFADHPSISERLFIDLALSITIRFLNFAEGVALTRRSAEKLFKFLDMYETLRDLFPENTNSQELKSEIDSAKSRLGEAAASIFCDLENSIRRDNGRTPVPSGAVHPLTRYTMNYLEYACEYKDTLEQIFQRQLFNGESHSITTTWEVNKGGNDDGTPKTSPFAVQLNTIMDLLDENLEMKSKLYRDPALGNVFLMNNGRYILQKIKGSTDINEIMGAKWCRKRSSDLRQYHKEYTRETWGRLLQCLSHEGLQVNGKVMKTVLKERFKMFNSMFDEIHKTQSTWVVSDDQLQSELRVSVSAVVIPAYRSFLGRFQQYLSNGRQTEKYIKYQPEDIETAIDDLFDGNPSSLVRRK